MTKINRVFFSVFCTDLKKLSWYRRRYGRLQWVKELNPTQEKQPQYHYPSSTKLYSWHNAVRQVKFFWHPPNLVSPIRLPNREAWFVTPQNRFPLLQSPCFTPTSKLGNLLVDIKFACRCSAMETHSMKLPIFVLILMAVEVYNSLALESAEHLRLLASALCDLTPWLCGLPLRGLVAAAPKCFHFSYSRPGVGNVGPGVPLSCRV